MNNIKNILICGGGLMGKNIAFVMTQNPAFQVSVYDLYPTDVFAGIRTSTKQLVERGVITEEELPAPETKTADLTVTDYVPMGTAFVEGSAGVGEQPTGHTKDAAIKPDSNNVLTWVLKAVPAGEIRYVSTYEKNRPEDDNVDTAFDAADAQSICSYVIGGGVFADFEHPVTAAAAVWNGEKFELAAQDA